MFRKPKRSPAKAEPVSNEVVPVSIDFCFGDPFLLACRSTLVEEGVEPYAQLLAGQADSILVTYAIRCAVNVADRSDELHAWASSRNDDHVAQVLLGALELLRAWAARTGARSAKVSKEQWASFFDLARRSDAALHRAVDLAPSSPLPWTWLLSSGRALEISGEERNLRYERAEITGAWPLEAALQHIQSVSAKWGGSDEVMMQFANRVADAAPPGSPLGVLPAVGLFERAVADMPNLRTTLRGWHTDLAAIAARSVDHDQFDAATPDGARALNIMALIESRALRHGDATRHLELVGDRFDPFPWVYFGTAGVVIAQERRLLGLP